MLDFQNLHCLTFCFVKKNKTHEMFLRNYVFLKKVNWKHILEEEVKVWISLPVICSLGSQMNSDNCENFLNVKTVSDTSDENRR